MISIVRRTTAITPYREVSGSRRIAVSRITPASRCSGSRRVAAMHSGDDLIARTIDGLAGGGIDQHRIDPLAGLGVDDRTRSSCGGKCLLPKASMPAAPGGNPGRARSAHSRRAADARCSAAALSRPARPGASRRVSMFGAMPRLSRNCVETRQAAEGVAQDQDAPPLADMLQPAAMGHCMSLKLLRCIIGKLSVRNYDVDSC